MPLPKPELTEDKDAFIARCVSDATMVSEYPDTAQRYAICQAQWRDRADGKGWPTISL